jgi:hypothetical protein
LFYNLGVVVNLAKPGYPKTWGKDFAVVEPVVPEFVVLKNGTALPRLMSEHPATNPVFSFFLFFFSSNACFL